MGKKIGWIPLHRSIQECALWTDEEPFDRRSAWIDLLLMANHEDKRVIFDGKGITVGAGQRITSLYNLATRWHWSRGRVRRYLNLLEEEGMITRDSNSRRTTITIVNYRLYNDMRPTDDTTHEPTHGTTHGPTHGTQTTMINNDNNEIRMINNDNNDNKKRKSAPRQTFGEYHHVKLTEEEFNRLCNDYGETDTLKAIKILDEYCQESGKTYKDYNLTLRRWPISEAQKGKTTPKSAGAKDLDTLFAEWDQKYGGNNNDKGNI